MPLPALFRRKKKQPSFAPLPEDYPAQLTGFSGTPREYFAGIFNAAFPGFSLEENVSVKALFGDSPESRGCRPISLLLRRDKAPALAVILCPAEEGDLPDVLNTISMCQMQKLPCHRYYTEWHNRSQYVVERTREALEPQSAQSSKNKG